MSPLRGTALLALAFSLVAVAGVLAYRHFELATADSATTVQLAVLDGSGTRRLSDWRGTPIVVNLFASWCPACLSEMPRFERASHEYAGRVAVVGVDTKDSRATGLRLTRELGITYPLLADTDRADLYASLQGQGMPVTAFIRRDGRIKHVYSGELDDALLRELIDDLLRQ